MNWKKEFRKLWRKFVFLSRKNERFRWDFSVEKLWKREKIFLNEDVRSIRFSPPEFSMNFPDRTNNSAFAFDFVENRSSIFFSERNSTRSTVETSSATTWSFLRPAERIGGRQCCKPENESFDSERIREEKILRTFLTKRKFSNFVERAIGSTDVERRNEWTRTRLWLNSLIDTNRYRICRNVLVRSFFFFCWQNRSERGDEATVRLTNLGCSTVYSFIKVNYHLRKREKIRHLFLVWRNLFSISLFRVESFPSLREFSCPILVSC